jgi:small subunit ribosomal protein S2
LIERGQATPELLSSITLDQFITHGVAEEGSEE